MSDKYISNDINAKGYGSIAKIPMIDKRLSIEAKAIYAFFRSYSGAGNSSFPSVPFIIDHLGISERRFYKYRKELIDYGYLKIIHRYGAIRNDSNVYITPSNISSDPIRFDSGQNDSGQNDSGQNDSGISNSFSKVTAFKSNSKQQGVKGQENNFEKDIQKYKPVYEFIQQKFITVPMSIYQKLDEWIDETSTDQVLGTLTDHLDEALKIANQKGKRKTIGLAYAIGILRNSPNGIVTPKQNKNVRKVAEQEAIRRWLDGQAASN